MSYENAPATKLLATNCACCGRALVDAVSVETGVGPDCREMHGYEEAQGPADMARAAKFFSGRLDHGWSSREPRAIVNQVVHLLASPAARVRENLQANDVAALLSGVDALGFTVLAARIAARLKVEVARPLTDEEVRALRVEYAKLRVAFCYGFSPAQFDEAVRARRPADPADYVACARNISIACPRCAGSGTYLDHGECYRCEGKGSQSQADVDRNRAYDRFRRGGRAA